MIFASVPALKSIARGATAAFGLALVTWGCSDSGVAQAESNAAARSDGEETEASHPSGKEAGIVGTMTIDGQPHDLTLSYWCEPETGVESGTTVAIRVAAYDDSGDVMLYALQVDRDRSRPPVQTVSAATDPNTNYRSGDVTISTPSDSMLVVENGTVRIQGEVRHPGSDAVDLEAEFLLPAEPGFPGFC